VKILRNRRPVPTAWLLVPLLFLASLSTASAQPGSAAQAAPGRRTYVPGEVHVGQSRIYVHVSKAGLVGHEHAVVGLVKSGTLHLGAAQDAGEITVDLGSFLADPEAARKVIGLSGTTDAGTQEKVTANMLGPDVLNIAEYPTTTAKFRSARLLEKRSKRGMPQYALEGELTFHGMTRKLQVLAETEENDQWIRLRTRWPLVQSDFGLKPYSLALGSIGVADQVEILCDLYLAKGSAESQAAAGAKR
jgi:hypothetical protein